MEKEGAIRLFQRSLTNGPRYKRMLCYGDASAYEADKYCYIEQQHLTEINRVSDDSKEGCVVDIDANYEDPSGNDTEEDEDPSDGEQILVEVPQDEDTNSVSSIKSQTVLLVIKEDCTCINHIGKRVKKYLMKLKQEKTQRIQPGKPTKKL